jgi:hypothetical protein
MHFVEVGAWQGLKPAVHPKHLRGAEAPPSTGRLSSWPFSATCYSAAAHEGERVLPGVIAKGMSDANRAMFPNGAYPSPTDL